MKAAILAAAMLGLAGAALAGSPDFDGDGGRARGAESLPVANGSCAGPGCSRGAPQATPKAVASCKGGSCRPLDGGAVPSPESGGGCGKKGGGAADPSLLLIALAAAAATRRRGAPR